MTAHEVAVDDASARPAAPHPAVATSSFRAALTVLGALTLFALTGFVDGGGDYVQYLLPAYAARDPLFALNDWFVHETTAYHLSYGWLTSVALRLGVLPHALLAWHLATLTALSWTALRWVIFLSPSSSTPATWPRLRCAVAFAVVLLALAAGFGTTWGERTPVGSSALPAFLAIPLVLGLWLAALEKRLLPSGVWFAVLALVHAQAAAVAGCAALPLLLLGRGREVLRDRRTWIGLVVALAGVAPSALLLRGGPTIDAAPVPDEIFDVLFYGRAPHHFAPHLAHASVHIASAAALAACALGVVLSQASSAARRALGLWWIVLTTMFALSSFFLVVVYWPPAVFAFPLRVMPALLIVGAALLAAGAVSGRPFAGAAALAVAGCLVHPRAGGLGVALVGAGAAHALLEWRGRAAVIRARVGATAVLVVLALASADAAVRAVRDAPRPSRLLRSWPDKKTGALFRALEQHTAPGSVIATPPGVIGVQIGANRAVVVDFKCAPLVRATELAAWRERMLALTGLDPLTISHELGRDSADPAAEDVSLIKRYRRAYAARRADELLSALAPYHATHVVAPTGSVLAQELEARDPQRVLWRSARWVLFRIGT